MKLYIANKNYSSWSLRPWLVLKHFGIAFDEEQLLLSGDGWKERIEKISPTGNVPLLVDGDLKIPESLAIIEYLNDKYPAKGIWPSNRVERALARSAATEMLGGFRALRSNAPMNLKASHPGKVPLELVARDLKRIERLWADLISRSGGPFLFGSFTGADAMFAPVAARIRIYALPVTDLAAEYVDALYALPAFQEWLAAAIAEPWVVEDDEIETIIARREAASGL
jgi:glutathione S-transferase